MKIKMILLDTMPLEMTSLEIMSFGVTLMGPMPLEKIILDVMSLDIMS